MYVRRPVHTHVCTYVQKRIVNTYSVALYQISVCMHTYIIDLHMYVPFTGI